MRNTVTVYDMLPVSHNYHTLQTTRKGKKKNHRSNNKYIKKKIIKQ